jgi:hypothetical protein
MFALCLNKSSPIATAVNVGSSSNGLFQNQFDLFEYLYKRLNLSSTVTVQYSIYNFQFDFQNPQCQTRWRAAAALASPRIRQKDRAWRLLLWRVVLLHGLNRLLIQIDSADQ